jgi:hypothetical protein
VRPLASAAKGHIRVDEKQLRILLIGEEKFDDLVSCARDQAFAVKMSIGIQAARRMFSEMRSKQLTT